jgi:hypothetical protein
MAQAKRCNTLSGKGVVRGYASLDKVSLSEEMIRLCVPLTYDIVRSDNPRAQLEGAVIVVVHSRPTKIVNVGHEALYACSVN